MRFIRAEASAGTQQLREALVMPLSTGKKVLWFISGGSNIPITVEVMKNIPDELTNKLVIMPIDERYGPINHQDSNAAQLYAAGFTPKQALFIPVLDGSPIEQTLMNFEQHLQENFATADVVIAQLGIGNDGHVSGILPHSPAVTATSLATSYQGPDYLRVTTTFPALRKINAAYVFAYGNSKLPALQTLHDANLALDEQPSQILKTLSDVYIYNDQIE